MKEATPAASTLQLSSVRESPVVAAPPIVIVSAPPLPSIIVSAPVEPRVTVVALVAVREVPVTDRSPLIVVSSVIVVIPSIDMLPVVSPPRVRVLLSRL